MIGYQKIDRFPQLPVSTMRSMDHSKLKLPSGYLTMEVTHVFQGSFHGETSETSFLLASPWYLTVANMFGHIKKSLPEKDCIH